MNNKIVLLFLLVLFAFWLDKFLIYNNQIKMNNICGDWLRFAKNVKIKNEILCANLRMEMSSPKHYLINNNIWVSYQYNKDCVKIDKLENICLTNNNGYFEKYIRSPNETNYSRSQKLPKGSFYNSVHNITHYYDVVCGYFLSLNEYVDKDINIYIEKCTVFDEINYLINYNGNFKKLSYSDFIIYEYKNN